jgi:ABC-type multidrug transport system fused ATPase/permease subunit
MYEPTQGAIFLNDVNIADYDVSWLRSQIAVVEQEPVLFSGTIYDNIHYGCPGASGHQIMEAARQANAHEFIMGMPQEYQTPIGPRDSTQLSGGQKQRLALARAFLKNAPVLVLDEATSALDIEAETQVLCAMQRLFGERTILLITHRDSALDAAHSVAVVSNGSVLECRGNTRSLTRKVA